VGAAPQEPYGPVGDSGRHLSAAELELRYARLGQAPRNAGHLLLIVRRLEDGTRDTPDTEWITGEEGLRGDRWGRGRPRDIQTQLTVMRGDVAALIANGQPLTVFGDNLFVDLDISTPNLPPGSRLRVGQATVTVTPEPHNGCAKFKGRFGDGALRFVSARPSRDQNLRGIHWAVVEPGPVRVGDTIEVLSRR
jgi:hypothetical protein